jgi:hypothetical protein
MTDESKATPKQIESSRNLSGQNIVLSQNFLFGQNNRFLFDRNEDFRTAIVSLQRALADFEKLGIRLAFRTQENGDVALEAYVTRAVCRDNWKWDEVACQPSGPACQTGGGDCCCNPQTKVGIQYTEWVRISD